MRKLIKLIPLFLTLLACSEQAPEPGHNTSSASARAPESVADTSAATREHTLKGGEAAFAHLCAPCHAAGEGHGGTMRLLERAGADKAVLTQRDDLDPAYISAIVRNGLGMMPAFRPTEISDAQLLELAEWLAQAGRR